MSSNGKLCSLMHTSLSLSKVSTSSESTFCNYLAVALIKEANLGFFRVVEYLVHRQMWA